MSTERGWSADPAVTRMHRVVTGLYEAQTDNPDDTFSIRDICIDVEDEPPDVVDTTNLLAQQGHARVRESLNSVDNSVNLSASGMSLGSAWTTRRSDPAERRAACRAVILDLLNRDDDEYRPLELHDNPRGAFFGDRFAPTEIARALGTLKDRGLIQSMDSDQVSFIRVRITEGGRDCSERYGGDVDAWFDRGQTRGGDRITNTFNNSPGALAMTQSPGGQQFATVTISTDARQQLLTIADQIIENLAALDLDDESTTAARELRALAEQPQADKGRAKQLLAAVALGAASAAGTEAGQVVMNLVSQGVRTIAG
jgi:hypothetical protein